MLEFNDWALCADGQVIAQQFDNLTRNLVVKGDIPADWTWTMLVQVGEAMDILPLTFTEEGLGIVLTAEQLSVSGYYTMQLKAVRGELVRHTNSVCIYVPASLSGDEQWPTVPSEFSDLERRATEAVQKAEKAAAEAGNGAGQVVAAGNVVEKSKVAAQTAATAAEESAANAAASAHVAAEHRNGAEQAALQAENHASHPPIIGENSNWWGWDGVQYVDSGKPSQGEMTAHKANTLYANALKGTASGAAIRLDDISPLEHSVKVKVSGADDLTAVKVMAQGKNVIPRPYTFGKNYTACGITFRTREDGTISLNGTSSAMAGFYLWDRESSVPCPLKNGVTYIMSCKGGTSSTAWLYISYKDPETGTYVYLYPGLVFTWNSKYQNARIYIQVNGVGMTFDGLVICPQIEVGTTVTEYEPHTVPVTYPATEDGTCEVTSIAPTMTLTTDTNGAVMDCEYNRDINKAFEELTRAIISMGGNI